MADGISIKATTIKPGARSSGRVATSTRTLLRGVSPDAHPAEIMSAMSEIFPMLDNIPLCYHAHGVRYDLIGVERRTVNGVRISRAVFKDERRLRKSFAREMRRRHRASRKMGARAGRDVARRRVAMAVALLAMARSAHIKRPAQNALAARAPMLALPSLYQSYPTPRPLSAIPPDQLRSLTIWAVLAS